MITKVTLTPFLQITDPSWIKYIRYVESHPFIELTTRFKDGRPFEATAIRETERF